MSYLNAQHKLNIDSIISTPDLIFFICTLTVLVCEPRKPADINQARLSLQLQTRLFFNYSASADKTTKTKTRTAVLLPGPS